jgi:phospholipase/carboxylesterase
MEFSRKKIVIGSVLFVLASLLVFFISRSSIFVGGNDLANEDLNSNSERKDQEAINENLDSDGYSLIDKIENSIGSNNNKTDTDEDGYSDLEEVANGYSPLVASPGGKLPPEEFISLKDKIKSINPLAYEKIFITDDKFVTLASSTEPANSTPPKLSGAAVLKEEVFLSNKNWKYSFYAPQGLDLNKELPLVICLHGFEGQAKEYIKYWQSDADKNGFLVAVLQAYPKTYPSGATIESYPWLEISDFAKAVLANVEKKYKIDENKIFLTGYSGGAVASYIIALDSGIRLKGVIPIDGYLPLEAGLLDKLSKSRDINFYVVHSNNDTNTKKAVSQEKILMQYGAKMQFKTSRGINNEYPSEEHKSILEWMNGLM